jgi:RHS repeat-associated protein
VTGWQANVQAGISGGAGILNQSYAYNRVGNLTQRQDGNAGLTENFYYDNLHRLDYSTLNGTTNLDISYDETGNIKSRSDVGGGASWVYGAAQKHAVSSAGGVNYAYDDNGNMTSRAGASITWTSYNYAASMPVPGGTATFSYGANRNYIVSTMPHPDGGQAETTYYVGGLLEKSVRGSSDDWRHYVKANGQTVAIVSRKNSGTNAVTYSLNDHLGSTAVITSSSGAILSQQSYGAFGNPRNATTWSGTTSTADQTTMANLSRRGYTDHTMVGFGGLVHMNGRVQDSITGRFLSPDPYVTEPGSTQGFNRYTYVRNNPLSYVDPSGFAQQCIFVEVPHSQGFAETDADGNLIGITVIATAPTHEPVCYGMPDVPDPNENLQGQLANPGEGGDGQYVPEPELEEVVVTGKRLARVTAASVAGPQSRSSTGLLRVQYRGEYHDQVVDSLFKGLTAAGVNVTKEFSLCLVPEGPCSRVDLFGRGPDGKLFVIEVKTGVRPSFTWQQLAVYPHLDEGGLVYSPDAKARWFGLQPQVPLPPIGGYLYRKVDEKSPGIPLPFP